MRFITEVELRDLYRKEPFTAYHSTPETRLTPGARQFLRDHSIKMDESEPKIKKKPLAIGQVEILPELEQWMYLKLYSKMKSIEALLLLTAEELLKRDVTLAQIVFSLIKQFSTIQKAMKNNDKVESLICHECHAINKGNFAHSLDDCIVITEFHMQLDKGREILILHRLRCALQEIEPIVRELFINCTGDNSLCEDMICKVNQIINSLSQLICSMIGGGKCHKQS